MKKANRLAVYAGAAIILIMAQMRAETLPIRLYLGSASLVIMAVIIRELSHRLNKP